MYSAALAEAPPWATFAFNSSSAVTCRARAAGSFSHWITCPATAADLSSQVKYSGNEHFFRIRLRGVVGTQVGWVKFAVASKLTNVMYFTLRNHFCTSVGQRDDRNSGSRWAWCDRATPAKPNPSMPCSSWPGGSARACGPTWISTVPAPFTAFRHDLSGHGVLGLERGHGQTHFRDRRRTWRPP